MQTIHLIVRIDPDAADDIFPRGKALCAFLDAEQAKAAVERIARNVRENATRPAQYELQEVELL